MPYQYDVLVSVKWDPIFSSWVRDHFLPLFQTYLRQSVIVECGRELQGLFYYKDDIEPGENWKIALKAGIKQSRCVVALCSPEYFYSDYCLLEWHSFSIRAKQVAKSLIVPISIHDGEAFPDYVRDVQREEFQNFVIVDEGFKTTARYGEFQDKLKKLATSVAKQIHTAPDFEDWPVAGSQHLAPAAERDVDISQEHL